VGTVVTLENLRAGIRVWLECKRWPADFHNDLYRRLFDLRKDGLSEVWWAFAVDRPWEWRAIRPLVTARMLAGPEPAR
jgi:hypothetical protein